MRIGPFTICRSHWNVTFSLCPQELETLRGGEAARLRELSAEQHELRSELEAVHSEQARQLSQARQEQLELETRLEQLRQQACACEPGAQRQQEAHYTAQVRAYRGTHACTDFCIRVNLRDIKCVHRLASLNIWRFYLKDIKIAKLQWDSNKAHFSTALWILILKLSSLSIYN